jgi:hypothetical protein
VTHFQILKKIWYQLIILGFHYSVKPVTTWALYDVILICFIDAPMSTDIEAWSSPFPGFWQWIPQVKAEVNWLEQSIPRCGYRCLQCTVLRDASYLVWLLWSCIVGSVRPLWLCFADNSLSWEELCLKTSAENDKLPFPVHAYSRTIKVRSATVNCWTKLNMNTYKALTLPHSPTWTHAD